jgi:hypothetical protein
MKTYKCQIPTWALNYLINADTYGLSSEDLNLVRNWEMSWGCSISISTSDETYFSNSPEFGLPCEVMDCNVLVYEDL